MTTETTSPDTIDEAARRRFEAAWREGRPQPIEHFLPPEDRPDYLATLEELVHIELEFLWRPRDPAAAEAPSTRPPLVEAYLARFPRLNQHAIVRRLLEQERLVRQLYGDRPTPGEYGARFPDLPTVPVAVEIGRPPEGAPGRVLPSIPGYEVLGVLGRGGMGVVYQARHLRLRRVVALKMILAGPHADPELLARFRAEAEAVARLQHPNVVQIYEVGEHDGHPYLALEFVDGGSLARYLAGTPLPAAAAAALVETLARAMNAVHQRGIIHRDLKPANILLASGGREPPESGQRLPSGGSRPPLANFIPKISDFGLAKQLEGPGQTQTGVVMGTPSYMAPEQAAGKTRDVGPVADIYALGAILYEMFTGRPPFKAATPMDTVMQVLSDEPVPPVRLQPKLPRDLETVCLKCLEKEPQRRYASALDLAEDLRRFGAGEPIRARPVAAWERGLKWARRRPAAAALLAVCSAVLLGLVLAAFWYNARLQADVEREQERTRQARRQQAETEQQRLLADANFRLACEAVDRMVTRVGMGPLARMPQMEEERRRVLEDALRFYQQFLEQRGTDPVVRQQTARASRRLGDIRRLLGRHAQAAGDYRRAIDLQERLTADFPDVPDYRQDLADSLTNWGLLLEERNQPRPAEAAHRRALAVRKQLTEDFPTRTACRKELADSHNNLGTLFLDRDQYDKAEPHLTGALAIQKKLVKEFPREVVYRIGVARTYNNLGQLLRIRKRLPEAERAFRRAIDLEAALAAASPDLADHRFDLANSYNNLGLVLGNAGQIKKAAAAYRKAIELQEKLTADFPSVPDFKSQLGGTQQNLAVLLLEWRQWRTACRLLEQAIREQQAALQAKPRHPAYRQSLRNHCHTLADILLEVGKPVEAAEAAQQPIAYADGWQEYHFAATVLAQCLPLIAKSRQWPSAKRQELTQTYAARAVAHLREAIRKGYPGGVPEITKELAPLRGNADFQKLLSELASKGKKGAK
jgi:tetratricopeptide (TPR) repeat protein